MISFFFFSVKKTLIDAFSDGGTKAAFFRFWYVDDSKSDVIFITHFRNNFLEWYN